MHRSATAAQTDGIATATLLSIKEHLQQHGQVLLYLNRRGYAPVLFAQRAVGRPCAGRCDARMTVHTDAPTI